MRPPSCLISGTHLRLREVFADANRDEWHCCNTGVLLHETYLITRRHSMVLEERDPVHTKNSVLLETIDVAGVGG
jgi:hypothetical protein